MRASRLELFAADTNELRERRQILDDVRTLKRMHIEGDLGGHIMPEDVHPRIRRDGAELNHYFALGMALNYQRNSYSLWRAATATFNDPDTRLVFDPQFVVKQPEAELARLLLKHRVALQPIKHVATWRQLCATLMEFYNGDVRNLFQQCDNDIKSILVEIQQRKKANFPYLSGPKIANYWLYVVLQYTSLQLKGREALNVAPDTHVIQASAKLGVVSCAETDLPSISALVAQRWEELLEGTGIAPIDIHTPLWLWSKGGFRKLHYTTGEALRGNDTGKPAESRAEL